MESCLICLSCRGDLETNSAGLTCARCGAVYETVRGVPVLLPHELSRQQIGQAAYFDAEFSGYGAYRPENWRRSFAQRVVAATGLEAGDAYLDIGVGGSGVTVIEAARRGVDATGCDLSVEGVVHAAEHARSEGVGDTSFFVACAAEQLPFADESFAAVSAIAVLEHVDDDLAMAREIARVLKPGGRAWLTVPHAYRHIPLPLWPVYLLHDRRLGHKRHYSAGALQRVLAKAGLVHRETLYSGHPVKLVQLVADRIVPASRRDSVWWALERADLKASRRRFFALQLNAVFERPLSE